MSNEPAGVPGALAVRICLGLLVGQALTGCGGGTEGTAAAPPAAGPEPPAPAISQDIHGRFIGTVKIGDSYFAGDALLTVDGAMRLSVGGPALSSSVLSGVLPRTGPQNSAQLVGSLDARGDRASGDGVIIGQGCVASQIVRFCGESGSAEISVVGVESGNLEGEIRISSNGGETWLLALFAWENYYTQSARDWSLGGQYVVDLAEFSLDSDTILTIDGAGRLFFQSAHSGCTGNGETAPHLDGAFLVHDVTLVVENCNAPYAHLNGSFEGLASATASDYWAYDVVPMIWLSKGNATTARAAVTMRANRL
jgi:hypothetical protein